MHFEHFHRRVHDAFGALDALAPKSTAGAACAAEPPASTPALSPKTCEVALQLEKQPLLASK